MRASDNEPAGGRGDFPEDAYETGMGRESAE
jgi:hypothetical protein